MSPGWGRKKCSRRTCPLPLCVPMPRPCLDSLRIPKLPACALRRTPRTEYVPRGAQFSCPNSLKYPICHCVDKNYCTAETCTNPTNCIQSQNIFNLDGLKGNKDENGVCEGPCRQWDSLERNYVEDYEKNESACNEASCEKLENCGIGSISNDEELNNPVTYTPSFTNQNSLSRTAPRVLSRQVPFNDNSAGKVNTIDNPSISRQIFTGSSLDQSSNVDKIYEPRRNKKNAPAREGYDTNSPSHSQSSQTAESHLNSHVSNIEDNSGYYRNNVISLTDENDNNPNKPISNSSCKHSYDLPSSHQPKSQEQLNDTENGEFGNVYQRIRKMSPQNVELLSKQFDNQAKRNQTYITPMQSMQSASARSPATSKNHLGIPDNSQNILLKKNAVPNFIPSSTNPYINPRNSNELSKISLSDNNSSNERRLLNESKNQCKSTVPNDYYKNGTTQRYLNSSESAGQKPAQFMSPAAANYQTNRPPINQPIRPYPNPPLTNTTSQVNFHEKNNINNATYSSPIDNQNLKYNVHPRPSEIQQNQNRSKESNDKIHPTNSNFSDHIADTCKDCKQGHCTHNVSRTTPKIDCVCSDEVGSWTDSTTRCEKKPACVIEVGATSCASTTCVVNQHVECSCRYPPAFKQLSCAGNLSGICNCNEKN